MSVRSEIKTGSSWGRDLEGCNFSSLQMGFERGVLIKHTVPSEVWKTPLQLGILAVNLCPLSSR